MKKTGSWKNFLTDHLLQASQGLGGFYRRPSIVDLRWRTSAAAVGMKRVESVS